jgi:hypothetical protein
MEENTTKKIQERSSRTKTNQSDGRRARRFEKSGGSSAGGHGAGIGGLETMNKRQKVCGLHQESNSYHY